MRPEAISILGRRYQVDWVAEFAGSDDRKGAQIGQHLYSRQIIRVLEGLPGDGARETLLHEALHSLDASMDTNLRESQVARLSVALYALAQESPEAVRWMLNLSEEK